MKIIKIICVICMFVAFLSACGSSPDHSKQILSFRLTTQYEPSYMFLLTENKKLIVTKEGESTAKESKSIYLSNEEYDQVEQIIKKLESTSDIMGVNDYWEVELSVNNQSFYYTYGCSADKNFDEIIAMLIRYSPIDIIDRYGDLVEPCNKH